MTTTNETEHEIHPTFVIPSPKLPHRSAVTAGRFPHRNVIHSHCSSAPSLDRILAPITFGVVAIMLCGQTPAWADQLEALPPQAVIQFNQQLDQNLTSAAGRVTGQRDSSGRLLDPNGDTLSPHVVKGLLLTRDIYVAQLRSFAAYLDDLRSKPRSEKLAFVREMQRRAQDVKDAYVNMIVVHNTATQRPRPQASTSEERYNNYMRQAEWWKKQGNQQKADEYLQEAEQEGWALYLRRREAYLQLLDQSPVLGIKKDGTFSDTFFYEALNGMQWWTDGSLREGRQEWRGIEADQALIERLNEYLELGKAQALAEARSAAAYTSLDDLWQFGSGRYLRQQQAAAALGREIKATLPGLLIDELQTVFSAVEAQNAFSEGVKEVTIGILAAGSLLIPVIGPWVSAGFTAIQVYRDGSELVVAYRTLEEVERTGGVTGYTYLMSAEDRADAAEGKLVFTVLTGVGEISAISGVRVVRGSGSGSRAGQALAGAADEVLEGTGRAVSSANYLERGAAKARALGFSQEQVDNWLRIARSSTAQDSAVYHGIFQDLAKLDDTLDSFRALGLPEDEIEAALINSSQRGILGYVQDLPRELLIRRANHEGWIIMVHQNDLQDLLSFGGAVRPRRYHVRDMTSTLGDLKSKANLHATGRPQQWTPAEVEMARRILRQSDEELLRIKEFHVLETDEPAGLLNVFDQETIDNLRSVFRDGGPTPVPVSTGGTPRPPGAGGSSVPSQSPTPARPPGFDSRVDTSAGRAGQQAEGLHAGGQAGVPQPDANRLLAMADNPAQHLRSMHGGESPAAQAFEIAARELGPQHIEGVAGSYAQGRARLMAWPEGTTYRQARILDKLDEYPPNIL